MKPDYSTVLYSLPGLVILVTIESIELLHEHRFGKGKNAMFASVFIGIIAIAIGTTLKGFILIAYTWVYHFRVLTLPTWTWWTWLICIICDDFSYYWFHRCSHQVRFFWASHIVHHSPQHFTLTSAFRVPWTSNITGTFLFWAWMPFLGVPPAMIIISKTVSALYQLWLHTEKIKKMPVWFEAIFSTPSHHRVHHATEVEHLDKNHGGTFIIWDKLFGTFCPETYTPIYGLTENINSNNPLVIEFTEWGNMARDLKKARSLRDCFNFIFNSPGWSNDGSGKTTKALRKMQAGTLQHEVGPCKSTRPNKSTISYATILILFIMLFFISPKAIAQDKVLNYDIRLGGSKIGRIVMSKHDSLNMSFIKTNCEARKRFIFLYTLTEKQESFFEKGMLMSSHVFRKVNNTVKVDQRTQFSQNFYTVKTGAASQNIMVNGIFNNQSTLYFAEPVNIKKVYSDVYAAFLDIEKVSNGVYKLILPDGNVNYYYYTNGICSKVHIGRTLFTVDVVLVKEAQ